MHIWDLGSQDSIQRNQQQAFAEADIFMICFDLSQKTTLDSVSKWVEEIESSEKKDVPRVLVGCKSDLRGNLATQD
jgi:GTPase SAR1 family protein